MTDILSAQDKKTLIVQVERHSPKLAAWLKKKSNITLRKEVIEYGKKILSAGTTTEPPRVGIVMRNVVEVQGQIPSLTVEDGRVCYPLALRGVGETIGEVEHAAHRLQGGRWRRAWNAYAGMQTFYFTPLKGSNNQPFADVRKAVASRAKDYKVEIAWIDHGCIDSEGEAALSEISLGRLLTITSTWLPEDTHLEDVHNVAVNGDKYQVYHGLLGAKKLRLRAKNIRLYREVIRALQGVRLAFRPFTEQEMKEAMPWDNRILARFGDGTCKYDQFLVLGIHNHKFGERQPFVILPHFFCRAYASPESNLSERTEIGGDFRTDLIHAVILAHGICEKLKEKTTGNGEQNAAILVSAHTLFAVFTNHEKNAKKGKTQRTKGILASTAGDNRTLLTRLRNELKLSEVKECSDLSKLGFLGKASLVIFPE